MAKYPIKTVSWYIRQWKIKGKGDTDEVCFYLNGTIVFIGQPISEKILDSLQKVREDGHEIVFASARPIRDMLPVIDHTFHQLPMIGGNGSLIGKEGKVVKSHPFPEHVLKEMKRLIVRYEATYLIDGEWNYAYTGPLLELSNKYRSVSVG
ncbi:HAD hydrolase family protein [Ureibacillus sp. FSL K6-3587]|uniref:HAD hydrolase family protein n=1 Tax=unclassified Ureibacillus TaxID=2638520 RepID=UPI00315963AD